MGWGYGPLASEVYDRAYPVGHSMGGDVAHYLAALEGLDGTVLEPAVGHGRFLVPMLEAGLTVTGYDLSRDMLELCRRRCAERGLSPALVEADMTTYVAPTAVDAVVVPTGSITLLDGREETLAALRCFRRSLRPGGLLMVDVPAPPMLAEPSPLRTWRDDDVLWTLTTMGIDADPARNSTTTYLRYERWVDGSLDATELMPFRLQHWSVGEFTALVVGAGFSTVEVTADRCGAEPGADSEIWTFSARA